MKTSLYLRPGTRKALDLAKKHTKISKSHLVNECINNYLPVLMKQADKKGSLLNKYCVEAQFSLNSEKLLFLRKRKLSQIFFYRNFLALLKKILFYDIGKKQLLELLDIYVELSKQYKNNKTVTKKIQKLRAQIKKSTRSIKIIKKFLEVDIIMSQKETEDAQKIYTARKYRKYGV